MNHRHAVTALSNGNSYSYDANGNMTQRVVGGQTFNLGYDAENRMVSVSGAAAAAYTYTGDGQRIVATEGVTTTVYLGNYLEWAKNGETITTKSYYYAGMTRVAMRQDGGAPLWLFGDHLGSTSVVANYDGSAHGKQGYQAWGETRFVSGDIPTSFQYTGQRNEASIGLHYYGARWYDSSLGRFAQTDTIVPDSGNPLDWDRYAYVRNNSIQFTDPTGHWSCGDEYDPACAESTEETYEYWVATGEVDPLPEGFEIPDQFPTEIQDPKIIEIWIWLWNSDDLGKELAKYIRDNNIPVIWGSHDNAGKTIRTCKGSYCYYEDKTIYLPTRASAPDGVRQILSASDLGHEVFHLLLPLGLVPDSLLEEFLAHQVGAQIAQALNLKCGSLCGKNRVASPSFDGVDPLNVDQLTSWFKNTPSYSFYLNKHPAYPWPTLYENYFPLIFK